MSEARARVGQELAELQARTEKLRAWLDQLDSDRLPTRLATSLLWAQLHAMQAYVAILETRLETWTENV